MKRFVPKEKLTKKARRELNAKARSVWPVNPVTRCPRSFRAYDRNKARKETNLQIISEHCSDYVQNERSDFHGQNHQPYI